MENKAIEEAENNYQLAYKNYLKIYDETLPLTIN